MDPLSITVSTITLMQTASSVSAALYDFSKTYRNADTKVSELCKEISALGGFLEVVDRALKECREQPLSVASMNEDLWRQITLSLADCQTTLGELEGFIDKIKATSKNSSRFRRVKVAGDLTMYSRNIAGFREKINKSNWALQTMLSAMNVSFSLRGNAAQDTILLELGKLKITIEESLRAAVSHGSGLSHTLVDPSDTRVSTNLRNLARAAQNFHSSASSTASTLRGTYGTMPGNDQSDTAMSIRGGLGLTPDKREQIQQYLRRTQHANKRSPSKRVHNAHVISVGPLVAEASDEEQDYSDISEMEDDLDEADNETEYELLFLSGLEKVAKESMLKQNFGKAETFLEKAIQRHMESSSGDTDFKQLQIQLAMCYFLQRKWRLAEPLVTSIAKSRTKLDPVTCNLLHTLALAHLSEFRFERAVTVCKQALQGKRRLKRTLGTRYMTECSETLGLLATIYDIKGDPIDAEVLRQTISPEFTYEHPLDEVEFIAKHPFLIPDVFGESITLNLKELRAVRVTLIPAELSAGEIAKPFYKGDDAYDRYINRPKKSRVSFENGDEDTAKVLASFLKGSVGDLQKSKAPTVTSEIDEADDEASPTITHVPSFRWPEEPISPAITRPQRALTQRISRFLGTVRGRPRNSQNHSTPPNTPDAEGFSSPLRRKLSIAFWSRIDPSMPKKTRTRLHKETKRTLNNPFSTLRTGFMKAFNFNRTDTTDTSSELMSVDTTRWVTTWLRATQMGKTYAASIYSDGLDLDSLCDYKANESWVPASHILAHEIGGTSIHELENNSSLVVELPGAFIDQDPVPWNPLKSTIRYRSFEPVLNPEYTHNFQLEDHWWEDSGIPFCFVDDQLSSQQDVRPKKPKLKLLIPNSNTIPGSIQLIAHYPRLSPHSPTSPRNSWEERGPTSMFVAQSPLSELSEHVERKRLCLPENSKQNELPPIVLSDETPSRNPIFTRSSLETKEVTSDLGFIPQRPLGHQLAPINESDAEYEDASDGFENTWSPDNQIKRSQSIRSWYTDDDGDYMRNIQFINSSDESRPALRFNLDTKDLTLIIGDNKHKLPPETQHLDLFVKKLLQIHSDPQSEEPDRRATSKDDDPHKMKARHKLDQLNNFVNIKWHSRHQNLHRSLSDASELDRRDRTHRTHITGLCHSKSCSTSGASSPTDITAAMARPWSSFQMKKEDRVDSGYESMESLKEL
ncbi:hypothetical protein F5884DRAFT_299418 [Xylogone sp. PMI_703]|nr:hypothetical protein F5884DRAFT_299418 [Xylogone sp. PMI_703]